MSRVHGAIDANYKMGRNGAGKSTLLKVIAGEVKVDGGVIQPFPR